MAYSTWRNHFGFVKAAELTSRLLLIEARTMFRAVAEPGVKSRKAGAGELGNPNDMSRLAEIFSGRSL
jgi:hypothetical protein